MLLMHAFVALPSHILNYPVPEKEKKIVVKVSCRLLSLLFVDINGLYSHNLLQSTSLNQWAPTGELLIQETSAPIKGTLRSFGDISYSHQVSLKANL